MHAVVGAIGAFLAMTLGIAALLASASMLQEWLERHADEPLPSAAFEIPRVRIVRPTRPRDVRGAEPKAPQKRREGLPHAS